MYVVKMPLNIVTYILNNLKTKTYNYIIIFTFDSNLLFFDITNAINCSKGKAKLLRVHMVYVHC